MQRSAADAARPAHRRRPARTRTCWSARPAADTRPRETPQHAAPSCCAAHCESVFSTGRLRVLTWVEQPVEVDHEIAHVGVVHGLLRLGFPRRVSGRIIGEYADDLHLVEILEGCASEIGQFAADHEMEQLLGGTIWHVSFPVAVPGKQHSRRASRALTATDDCENARQCLHDDRVPLPPAPRAPLPGDYRGWYPPKARSCYHSLPARSNWLRQGPNRGFGHRQRPRPGCPAPPGTAEAPAIRSGDAG